MIDLSRTFILIRSGTGGHRLLTDICPCGTFSNGILSFLPLSGCGAVGLGLHNVFSFLQLFSQRNACGCGCQVPNPDPRRAERRTALATVDGPADRSVRPRRAWCSAGGQRGERARRGAAGGRASVRAPAARPGPLPPAAAARASVSGIL